MVDITTKTARRKLEPRREPYWSRIAKCRFVGFRVSREHLDGTWIARIQLPEDGHRFRFKALGSFDEYDHAVKAAKSWFDSYLGTGQRKSLAVEDCCRHYVKELARQRRSKASHNADTRFSATVYNDKLGSVLADRLKPRDIKEWTERLPVKKASTVNYYLATLRAALNFAYRDQLVSSNRGWKGIKPTADDAPKNRDRWLDADERKRLLDACGPDLKDFLAGLLLSAARPGELAALRVKHFDPRAGTLHFPLGKTGSRTVPVSPAMLELLSRRSENNDPESYLFADHGKAWDRFRWSRQLKVARQAAGLGDDVIAYAIRHTAISEMLAGGVDAFTVAKVAGTSTDMIDKHYGHLRAKNTREMLGRINLIGRTGHNT